MGFDGFAVGKSGLLQAGLLRNPVGSRGFFFLWVIFYKSFLSKKFY